MASPAPGTKVMHPAAGEGAAQSRPSDKARGSAPSADTSRWRAGRKLFHDDYGYGIITKSFNSDGEHVIVVRFETGGEKRFMPRYQAHSLLLVED